MFLNDKLEALPETALQENQGLANNLSGLLRQGIADAQKIEKTPGYALGMYMWHHVAFEVCYVCLAGAMMACRLGAQKNKQVEPWEFDDKIKDKLLAVDAMRTGDMRSATRHIGVDISGRQKVIDAVSWLIREEYLDDVNTNGRAPWETYAKAADMLEAAGL